MLGQLGLLKGLEQWIARRLNRLAVDHIIHSPLGVYCRIMLDAGAGALFLGCQQDCVIFDGLPLQISHGDCPADSIASLTRLCTARVR
jgi:hypothetical protein